MKHSYHTQHAPLGAFASFTLGLHGAPGGFGQSLGGPARQNVYIGYRYAGEPWNLLPFFGARSNQAGVFTGPDGDTSPPADIVALPAGRYGRTLGWATDRWMAQAMVFSIASPFDRIDDLESLDEARARLLLAPALYAVLDYDNSHMDQPVELIFGIGDNSQPWRFLGDVDSRLCGFSCGNSYGYATRPSGQVEARQALDLFNPTCLDDRGLHALGMEHALIFRIPAGGKAVFPIALGFYDSARITTGVRTHFHYTLHFESLKEVLATALEQFDQALAIAWRRDDELRTSRLNEEQKFLLAQATHSYLGSSQLVVREDGRPLWIVNEGEYRMMNTFDLTVDHLFFELAWLPWAVRNVLDLFVEHYSYRDTVHLPGGPTGLPGGISFTHDMGVVNQFSRAGHSTYECTGISGCFSHMTAEQLVNWICCAVTYAFNTGDFAWLAGHRETLVACAQSLLNRDHPEPARRNGLVQCDSDRCGAKGAEITTYDSLDTSLGQARNNLYLAVKALAAWLLLERAFEKLELAVEAREATAAVSRIVTTLCSKFDDGAGMFPAVFEAGNRSRILPAVEGLVFPLYLGWDDVLACDGRLGPLLALLERHVRTALVRGVCLDAASGGWKMSSTSRNTWFSKIALAQHVVRRLFPSALSPEAAAADAVHAGWQRGPGCAPYAMCDQIYADNGRAVGSRYYPRGVTALLWMGE
jgi:xylan 1,4-beta-xylosidase